VTTCEFCYDDVTLTSFIDIKFGDIAIKFVLLRTACYYSFLWAKEFFADNIYSSYEDKYFTKPTIHVWCKKMLGWQKFASDIGVQSVASQWHGQQPASFFASSIKKLVDRWDKMFE